MNKEEYKEKQVLSFKDKIVRLEDRVRVLKDQVKDLESIQERRQEIVKALKISEDELFAAKESHKALLRSHDAERNIKEAELVEIQRNIDNAGEIYSHTAAENAVELISQDDVIKSRKETVANLVKQESDLRFSISRQSTDKVLILKETANTLEENRKAVRKLADIIALIEQADKDHKAGEAARRAEVDSLEQWKGRLDVRENDFNVIVSRMHPEILKKLGSTKLNAHVFKPSKEK